MTLRCPLCHGALDDASPEVHRCAGCETPFHAGCYRELGGCSTLGCATRAAPAAVAVSKRRPPPPRPASYFASGVVIVLAWFAVGFSGEVAALLALGAVAMRLGGGRRQALALLVTPVVLPFLAAGLAAVSYATGSATLLGVGLPGPMMRNLDPTVRCRQRSTGCIRDGLALLWNAPNNATLRALGAVFGPMPGAYDGPFPSAEEARAAARAATTRTTWEQLAEGPVTVGGRTVRLPEDVTSRFVYQLHGKPSLTLLHGRLVVIADHHDHEPGDPYGPCVVVVDADTSAFVALYPWTYNLRG